MRWLLPLLILLLVACGPVDAPDRAETRGPEVAVEPTALPTTAPPPESVLQPEPSSSPAAPAPTMFATPIGEELPTTLRIASRGWTTEWSQRTIPLEELQSGGVQRDQIPPIDRPVFLQQEEAINEIALAEPVVVVEHAGEARAYPLAILIWHEIVNDVVGGKPVSITYCPLCNSAIAFDRTLDGQTLDFGTSGLLRNSDLVMWDRQTESLWQQVTGEAIVGELAGKRLAFLPASILSFEEFLAAYPAGKVLSRETGFSRQYGSNPYSGYDDLDRRPFLFQGEPDSRLPAMERVVGLTVGDEAAAYPFPALAEVGVVNDEVGGRPVAIFYAPETLSALDTPLIRGARAVGSAVAYDPLLDGERLTFERRDGTIVDVQTGSEWAVTGQAISGPLAGQSLEVLPHANHFWFAFAAFYPDSRIWEPS